MSASPGVEVDCTVSFPSHGSLFLFVVILEYLMYASAGSTSGMARRVDARRR